MALSDYRTRLSHLCACTCAFIPKRYLIVMMCCLGMLIAHAMRVNIAVTVVTILDTEPEQKVGTIHAIISLPTVSWDARQIGLLHSIFYVGYFVTLIPGGYLATILPSHRLFGCALLMSSTLNLILPVSIDDLGYVSTCCIRVAQGLAEGLLFPSSYAILRHWTTPEEKSRMGAIVLTGVYTGAVIGLPLSGYITHFHGWAYVYYVHGGIGLVWFVFWLFLAYERPSQHPTISEDERKLIESKQGLTSQDAQKSKVPWKSIILSLPAQAINVCNFARSFVFFLLLTNEPAYINVFGFSIALNGTLSSLPHLLMAITAALSGLLADYMLTTSLSPTVVRKIFTCGGFGIEAVCFFILFFVRSGPLAIVFLSIGVGFSGFTISGWQINHLDLAPRYASVLVGISTACGTIAGIIVPIIIGHMTVDQSIENWQWVFLMTSMVVTVCIIFYGIFGSGYQQPWAEPLIREKVIGKVSPPSVRLTPVPTQVGLPTYGATDKPRRKSPERAAGVIPHPPDEENLAETPGYSGDSADEEGAELRRRQPSSRDRLVPDQNQTAADSTSDTER